MSSETLPEFMKAWTFSSCGTPREVLTLDPAFPVPPPPAHDDLLIRVTHVALNPGCILTMATISPWVRRLLGGNATAIAEAEFAGVVHLAGPAASARFAPGTRVFGNFPMMKLIGGAGAMAEYICVPEACLAVVPDVMKMEEVAGLGGAGQTAWNMFDAVKVRQGDRVLVNGSTGGVGIMAVQLAKAKGAHVTATCSGKSVGLVKGLGADDTIDYREHRPLHDYLAKSYAHRPFDVILDTIGTQTLFNYSTQYLKPHGALINVGNFEGVFRTVLLTIINTYLPTWLGGTPRRYAMISTTPNGEKAAQLGRMVEEGLLRVVVDEVVDFEDVLPAYDRMLRREAKGKIIVKVQDV